MPPIETDVPPPSLSAFSISSGRSPASRAASAVATPAMPEPTTTTSKTSSQEFALDIARASGRIEDERDAILDPGKRRQNAHLCVGRIFSGEPATTSPENARGGNG